MLDYLTGALVISTVKGKVRLQAILGPDKRRMIGTWYDTHGNDGGIGLLRAAHGG